jgi:predicted dehydrogenase
VKHIKAGIIGGGFVGKLHIEALRRLGWVEVAAILASLETDTWVEVAL